MGTLLLRVQGPLLFPWGGTEAAGGSDEEIRSFQASLHLPQRWCSWTWDAPVFLRFADVFTLAWSHLARDDGCEKCWVNNADSSIFQGGEFQRGADADGDYVHGSNEACTHNEGGPFKVFIQDEVSLNGKMPIIIADFYFTDLKKQTFFVPCTYIYSFLPL